MPYIELSIIFFSSMLGGVISSLPPGPLNFKLIYFHLSHKKLALIFFQSGIIITDALISIFAFMIAKETFNSKMYINFENNISYSIHIFFVVVLLIIGIKHLINSHKHKIAQKSENLSYKSEGDKLNKQFMTFLEGVVGTLTIPGLIPFWYLWWMGQKLMIQTPISYYVIAIGVGVFIGDLLVFKIYRNISDKLHRKIKKISTYQIEKWVGSIFILFSFLFFIQYLYKVGNNNE